MFKAPAPVLAVETLRKIRDCIEADQGAEFRRNLEIYIPQMADAYDSSKPEPRSHLGCSMLGRECEREIFYNWRWASKNLFSDRMLRLFNRGHLEEARMLAMLKMIGCEVWHQTKDGKQFRVLAYKGHVAGGCDGIVRGLPEIPNHPALAEFKTHNDKSFKELVKKGVRQSKFTHYVQMNLYMAGLGLEYAIYIAVNKNDDDLYAEIIRYDPEVAKAHFERGAALVDSPNLPKKISKDPSFYKCSFCDFKAICHFKKEPERNCRTCAFSVPVENGGWLCNQTKQLLLKSEQLAGCSMYATFPDMIH